MLPTIGNDVALNQATYYGMPAVPAGHANTDNHPLWLYILPPRYVYMSRSLDDTRSPVMYQYWRPKRCLFLMEKRNATSIIIYTPLQDYFGHQDNLDVKQNSPLLRGWYSSLSLLGESRGPSHPQFVGLI